MTIRRRLTLSFFAILCLLGLNLVIYFWSDIKRKSTFEEMRSAISRQILISSVQQDLSDFQKQVTLLSQITADAGAGGGASPEDIAQFDARLNLIAGQITAVRAQTPAGRSRQSGSLRRRVRRPELFLASLLRKFRPQPIQGDHRSGDACRAVEPARDAADAARTAEGRARPGGQGERAFLRCRALDGTGHGRHLSALRTAGRRAWRSSFRATSRAA